MMLEAPALPRERVSHASASFLKERPFTRSRHPRDRVTQKFGKKSFEQRVARTRGRPRTNGTNHSTRMRDPRVRVTS